MKLIVGLTGGIGSGKSSVGAPVRGATASPSIDADAISRTLHRARRRGDARDRAAFGRESSTPDGALDRARMRALVFRDPARGGASRRSFIR